VNKLTIGTIAKVKIIANAPAFIGEATLTGKTQPA